MSGGVLKTLSKILILGSLFSAWRDEVSVTAYILNIILLLQRPTLELDFIAIVDDFMTHNPLVYNFSYITVCNFWVFIVYFN